MLASDAIVAHQTFEFGSFQLDSRRGTLGMGGEQVFLRPKAYGLLLHLARNMGRVVPKAELMDAVWPGIYVTEDSLTQSIREIRKALAGGGQELIRTVPKRGYMLAGTSDAMPRLTRQPIVAVLCFGTDRLDQRRVPAIDGFIEDIKTGLALRLSHHARAQLDVRVLVL